MREKDGFASYMGIDVKEWLIVSLAPGIGPVKFHQLLECFGQPQAILKGTNQALLKAGLNENTIRFLRNPPPEKIIPNLAWAEAPENTILTFNCASYPEKLKELKDAPPLLYIKGEEKFLKEPQIALVGTRHPTPGGQANARKFSSEIASSGILINSGMASGIDTASHEAALACGSTTVAVIATGPDKIYPAKNKSLAERIAKQGVIVSEFPVGTEPIRTNFPRRNRIISALSLGVVVIEADLRSGALITARLAAEQGKEVFAVPGSIQNPKTQGCHRLIKQGAKLVEKTEDILLELQTPLKQYLREKEDMGIKGSSSEMKQIHGKLDKEHIEILEAMGYDPVDIDTLVQRCRFPVQTVSVALLKLQIENYVDEDSGVYTRLK